MEHVLIASHILDLDDAIDSLARQRRKYEHNKYILTHNAGGNYWNVVWVTSVV